jgi:hypothetical protein
MHSKCRRLSSDVRWMLVFPGPLFWGKGVSRACPPIQAQRDDSSCIHTTESSSGLWLYLHENFQDFLSHAMPGLEIGGEMHDEVIKISGWFFKMSLLFLDLRFFYFRELVYKEFRKIYLINGLII